MNDPLDPRSGRDEFDAGARLADRLESGQAWESGPRAGDPRFHEHHALLGSTNDRALQWLSEGAPHGAVVTCDRQDAGRGRLGRSWQSSDGLDLAMTMILRPSLAPHGVGALGLAVALGVREGIVQALHRASHEVLHARRWPHESAPDDEHSGVNPVESRLPEAQDAALRRAVAMREATIEIKWPNDLLLRQRKLAGILCEARWQSGRGEFLVGVGVNVGSTIFPSSLTQHATSLALEFGDARPSRALVLRRIVPAIETWTAAFFAGGFSAIRSHYEQACPMLGRTIQVSTGRPTGESRAADATAMQGESDRRRVIARGFADDGALLIAESHDAAPERWESGDVWLVPPGDSG